MVTGLTKILNLGAAPRRGAADSSSTQQDSADQLTSVQHPITSPANVDAGRLFDSSAKGGAGAWTTDLPSLPPREKMSLLDTHFRHYP